MPWLWRRRKVTPTTTTSGQPPESVASTANGAPAPSQHADGPNTPHDHSCVNVRPICPACRSVSAAWVPSIVATVQLKGTHVVGCGPCGKLSFQFDTKLICETCQWLVPDVNERLAQRYAANGGPFAPDADVCPGCGHTGEGAPLSFPVTCPRCDATSLVPQQAVDKRAGVAAICGNTACRLAVEIPSTIWCQTCRLNLRSLTTIAALIREANIDFTVSKHTGKLESLEDIARRLVTLDDTQERRYGQLTEEQRRLSINPDHLDTLVSGSAQPEEWIRSAFEIRSLGHRLNDEGGKALMRSVAERAAALSPTRGTLDVIDMYWDGIGDWEA